MIPAPEDLLEAPWPMNSSALQNSGVAAKAFISMTPCLLCLYINGVMLFSLGRRPTFLESSRYLLFGHLLLTDSLHLLVCVALYLLAVAQVWLGSLLCVFLLLLGNAIAIASPFTLALMSLERYVAVCLPLRHARISTPRRTGAMVTVVWCVAALDPISELLAFLALEDRRFLLQRSCHRKALLSLALFGQINTTFTVLYFLLVGAVILYTYVHILLAARSAARSATVTSTSTSAASRASKARSTVLLHMLQLCLCLVSTTFNSMGSVLMLHLSVVMARNIQYLLFLSLVILPRVLSPLIYGLRDNAFRRIFTHYFLFGLRTHRKPLA